jgi:hypothetical protein
MSNAAPAIGGASGSNTPSIQIHSAWNPYAPLQANLKRKVSHSQSSFPLCLSLGTAY